jgi:hypothetical protein
MDLSSVPDLDVFWLLDADSELFCTDPDPAQQEKN